VRCDPEKSGVRSGPQCPECGDYMGTFNSGRVFPVSELDVPERGFARTDLRFGDVYIEPPSQAPVFGMDERSPSIFCGDKAAEILRKGDLKGLRFDEDAIGSGILIPRELWQKSLPRLRKVANRCTRQKRPLSPPPISLKLRSGEVLADVLTDWSGQLIDQLPPNEWEDEVPAIRPEDIVAVGVPGRLFPFLWGGRKWVER